MTDIRAAADEAALEHPLIEARDLSKEFVADIAAVTGVNISLQPGELVILAGRNGSGKSVLCKMLAGLMIPSGGVVSFRGLPFAELKGSHARRVGYAFQEARLQAIGERVLDDCLFGPMNVGLGRKDAEERAREALEMCGLWDRKDAFVHSLSGGEQRRLSIAGILALEPQALILDEPFSNLDLDGVKSVLRIIQSLKKRGKGLVVATHEIEKVLGLAERIVILDRGMVVMEGQPAEAIDLDLEKYGLRNPLRAYTKVSELSWLQ